MQSCTTTWTDKLQSFFEKKKISLTSKEETTAMFKPALKVEPETAACVYFVRECHQDARVRQGK